MSEARKDALRLDFDRRLKLEFCGTRVTSDSCLFAYRKLDYALGLTSTADSELRDIRSGKNTQLRSSPLASNLGNFLRPPALSRSANKWLHTNDTRYSQ